MSQWKQTLSPSRADWLVPALLILLSGVPAAGGVVRALSMSRATPLTQENARFVADPLPILVHVVGGTLYAVLGAFQFSPRVRRRMPRLHRPLGRVLAPCGALAGASGVLMALAYDIPAGLQGPLLCVVRVVVGTTMVAAIALGSVCALRGQLAHHRAWMIRAYALGQGAGTQVLVLLPWMLVSGQSGGLTRDLLMTLAWLLNALVAEWLIRRHPACPR